MRDLIIKNSLYVVTDSSFGRSHVEIAGQAIKGGARVIQLREKRLPKREIYRIALELREMTKEAGATFIVNDYLDIAMVVDADGVHLGQKELPVDIARRIWKKDKIIGLSTHSIDEAIEAVRASVDYISIGPIYETKTKEIHLPIGTEVIRRLRAKIEVPLVAIGGINLDNVSEIIRAGADGVAVISAIAGSSDISETTKKFLDRIEKYKKSLMSDV